MSNQVWDFIGRSGSWKIWKHPVAVLLLIVWTIAVLGMVLGTANAYQAEHIDEVTMNIDKELQILDKPNPNTNSPVTESIDGTTLGWLHDNLMGHEKISNLVHKYITIPGVAFGLSIANITGQVVYNHLLWVPTEYISYIYQFVGIAPWVGYFAWYIHDMRGLVR